LGENTSGANSLGEDSLGEDSLGEDSLGEDSLVEDSLGEDSLGEDSLGEDSLGEDSLGEDSLGTLSATALTSKLDHPQSNGTQRQQDPVRFAETTAPVAKLAKSFGDPPETAKPEFEGPIVKSVEQSVLSEDLSQNDRFDSTEPDWQMPVSNVVGPVAGPGVGALPSSVQPPPSLSPVMRDKIVRQISYGKTLARRGAIFAARDELMLSLQRIVETLDQQTGTRSYSRALTIGLTALEEAADFAHGHTGSDALLDVGYVAKYHQTPVLQRRDTSTLTPQAAMQQYFLFAEAQLSNALSSSPIAAEALHALGKTHSLPTGVELNSIDLGMPLAMIMYRTALAIDPRHTQSRNELAVLLAERGQYDLAKQHLLICLRIQPTPAIWQNLAQIHRAVGEIQQAQSAEQQVRVARANLDAQAVPDLPVRFASAEEMARMAPPASRAAASTRWTRSANPLSSDRQTVGEPARRGWFHPLKNLF